MVAGGEDEPAREDTAFADFLFGPEPAAAPPVSSMRFGDYELLEVLGRGGMGVVYRAWQLTLNRVVAVKMIPFGALAGDESVRRFKAEAEAAGQLRHPNIISIHEIGVRDGQHYFSMDYVDGGTLAEPLQQGPLPVRKAAECLRTVAGAVEHAHQAGILHRDLKPSNILLDKAGEPHVADFGLSRRMADESSLTLTGQVLGSPNYMPPEQASGGKAPVSAASDVYSLGAVLYHALTGRPPFHAETVEEVLTRVRRDDPVAPRLLNPAVPRDLETVCLKCLEKEAARRYASAHELGEELGRFLADIPVLAKPAGPVEKTWRWCRRRPAVATMVSALLAAILTGAAGVLWQWRRAEWASAETQKNLYAADMGLAYQALASGDRGRARRLLELYRRSAPSEPVAAGRQRSDLELRGWEWRYLWQQCHGEELAILGTHPGAVVAMDYSPDGRWLASGDVRGTLIVWDVAPHRSVLVTNFSGARIDALAFSPDGRYLAQATGRRTIVFWDARQWIKEDDTLTHPEVTDLAFSPDGKLLATANGTDVTLWNIESRKRAKVIPGSSGRLHPRHVAFAPDGHILAIGDENGVVVYWDWEADKARGGWRAHRQPAESDVALADLAFSPVGRLLMSSGHDRTLRLWRPPQDFRLPSPPSFRLLSNHTDVVRSVAFSRDGRRVASASQDQTMRLWDISTQQELGAWHAHAGGCLQVRIAPDGESMASGGIDGSVKLWPVKRRWNSAIGNLLPAEVKDARIVSDPPRLALELSSVRGDQIDRSWRVLHLPSFEELHRGTLASNVSSTLKAIGAGKIIEFGGRIVRLRHADNGREDSSTTLDLGRILSVDLAKDQQSVAVSGMNGIAVRQLPGWANLRQWTIPQAGSGRHVRLTPDAHVVVTVQEADGAVGFWDIATGDHTAIPGHLIGSAVLDFSRDGRWLATAGQGTSVRGYDVRARREAWSLETSGVHITAVAFSPDSSRVAGGMPSGRVTLWDLSTKREVATLEAHRGMIYSLAFIDENTLVTTTREEARVWQAPALATIDK